MPDHLLEYAMMEKIYILRQPFTCAMRTQKLLEQIPLLLDVKSQKATKCNFTILLFYCFEEFVESQHLKMLTGGIKIQTLQIVQTDKGNFVVLMV